MAPLDYLKKLIEEEATLKREVPERQMKIEWALVSWTAITKEQFDWFAAHGYAGRVSKAVQS